MIAFHSTRSALLLRSTALAALALAAAAPARAAASADAAAESADSAAEDSDAGSEILVTARHREEDVQDVPVAISVVDARRRSRVATDAAVIAGASEFENR